jgi:hypothetical protein
MSSYSLNMNLEGAPKSVSHPDASVVAQAERLRQLIAFASARGWDTFSLQRWLDALEARGQPNNHG